MGESEEQLERTAGGFILPSDWLGRVMLIWSGYAVSMFAGTASSYAGIWFVTETTGSPLYLAFLYVMAFLPMGLLAPFGGVLADRLNRKAIIVVADALLALCSLALTVWIAVVGPSFAAVAVYCAAFGVLSGFRTPAFNATMPLLVPERHLVRVNSLNTLVSSISMIAGPALGILLYTVFGLQSTMLLGFVGAAAAAVTMLLAKVPRDHGTGDPAGPWASLKEGAAVLANRRGLIVLVVGVSLGLFAYGPVESLLPMMVYDQFGGDGFAAALVTGVMGAGLLVGSVVLITLNPQNRLARIIIVAAFIVGTGALVSGLIPGDAFAVFVVCIGVLSVACAWFNAPLMTILQRNVDDDKLGRVMGLYAATSGVSIPLGTAAGGVIAEFTGTAMFYCIDGVFILLLGAFFAFSKSVWELNAA